MNNHRSGLAQKSANTIRARIADGVYAFRNLPSERELAQQLGISYMTARRAIQQLVREKVLFRNECGRAEVASRPQNGQPLRIALLMPAFNSGVFNMWLVSMSQVVKEFGAVLRPVTYVHWDDTLLWDALNGFDGSFLIPSSEQLPESVAERMRGIFRPPVILGYEDFSCFGLPSVITHPPRSTQRILDHLADQGHRRIACLNTQPLAQSVLARIGQWQLWMAARGWRAPLINEPVRSYVAPYQAAKDALMRAFSGDLDVTALFCVTSGAALGAYRALYERGWTPGREIAVATVDGEDIDDILVPSLTTIRRPDPTPYLRICLHWMQSRLPWQGPLLLQPEVPEVVIRESSLEPARSTREAARRMAVV